MEASRMTYSVPLYSAVLDSVGEGPDLILGAPIVPITKRFIATMKDMSYAGLGVWDWVVIVD